MAEATATRPTRGSRRAPSKAVPAKAAPVVAKAPEGTEVKDGNVERLVIALESAGDTKSYSKWVFPEGSGCVGTVYAPLGTAEVRVAMKGASE